MPTHYEEDFYGWAQEQVALLKNRDFAMIDFHHLIEEIESLGRSERRSLESHLENLLLHLLKIRYQPEKHTRSWDLSIKNSKYEIEKRLKANPSLRPALPDIFLEAFEYARKRAIDETGLPDEAFPFESPWPLEELV